MVLALTVIGLSCAAANAAVINTTTPDNVASGSNIFGGNSGGGKYLFFYSNQKDEAYASNNNQALIVKDVETNLALEVAPEFGTPIKATVKALNMSPSGQYVVFNSTGGELKQTGYGTFYMKDLLTGNVTPLIKRHTGTDPAKGAKKADVSDDGQWVVFTSEEQELISGVNSSANHGYLFNTLKGTYYDLGEFIHMNEGVSNLSASGKELVIAKYENNISNLYFIDTSTMTERYVTTMLSNNPHAYSISNNGKYIIYLSASGLVRYDIASDAHDVLIDTSVLDKTSKIHSVSIANDGRQVAFASEKEYWTPNQTNANYYSQVNYFNTEHLAPITISVNNDGVLANGDATYVKITETGDAVYFGSMAGNLDVNATTTHQIYKWENTESTFQCQL